MTVPRTREVGSMPRTRDCGVALILVMLSMLVLSVLAATIVFTARSETLASYNYKLDTQADYLAKAGIQYAINWFRSSHYKAVSQSQVNTYYEVASTGVPWNLYTAKNSPVICKSGCPSTGSQVQLIAYGSGSSNYPNINNDEATPRAVATAFASDLVNVRVTGDANNSGIFTINAILLNYQTVMVGTPPSTLAKPVETWLITSKAWWTGGSSTSGAGAIATAEEQAIVQPIYLPTWGNALYGYCSVKMQGSSGVCTDAFNSALGGYAGGNPTVAAKGCDSSSTNVITAGAGVGANGGVTLGSNVTVSGDVTIGTNPTTGCTAAGCSGCTTSNVLGTVVNGPHINPPAVPTFPSGFPTAPAAPNVSSGTWPQTDAGGTPSAPFTPPSGTYTKPCPGTATCNGSAANPYQITELSGAVTLYGGPDVYNPVYYDIDSIDLAGNNELTVRGFVVWNVKTSLEIHGNGISNPLNNPPESCQINFAGTAAALGGNGAMTAIVTAPNADVTLKGGGSGGYMVGSIQAKNIDMQGGYPLHYDVQLNRAGGTMGVVVTTGYSRKKM